MGTKYLVLDERDGEVINATDSGNFEHDSRKEVEQTLLELSNDGNNLEYFVVFEIKKSFKVKMGQFTWEDKGAGNGN